MPFLTSFSETQSFNCSSLQIIDISDYSVETKSVFSARTLQIYRSDGTLLNAGATNFSFASYPSDVYTLPGVDRDYALRIVLTHTPITPVSGSVYSKEFVCELTCFIDREVYGVCQNIAADQSILDKPNFVFNLNRVYNDLQNSKSAIRYSDQQAAQNALDRATSILVNKKLFF